MTDIENLRLNWRDEDGSAQFASPLRTAAAVYIVALETENAGLKTAYDHCVERELSWMVRSDKAEAENERLSWMLHRCMRVSTKYMAEHTGVEWHESDVGEALEHLAEAWTARSEEGGGK